MGLTGVIISVIASTVAAAEPAVCQGVDWRIVSVSTAVFPHTQQKKKKTNSNDSELCKYFPLHNRNGANLVLGRQLGLIHLVKGEERNGEWEVRKDGRNVVRAEVRLGDGGISIMFRKKKIQPTKQKQTRRAVFFFPPVFKRTLTFSRSYSATSALCSPLTPRPSRTLPLHHRPRLRTRPPRCPI